MSSSPFLQLKGITPQEFEFLQQVTSGFTDQELNNFMVLYSSKRRDPTDLLLFTLLGFVIIAGVQRFMVNQIGMGILYLLTGGLCLIGTIVDLVNYKSLANDFNYQQAFESARMVRGRA